MLVSSPVRCLVHITVYLIFLHSWWHREISQATSSSSIWCGIIRCHWPGCWCWRHNCFIGLTNWRCLLTGRLCRWDVLVYLSTRRMGQTVSGCLCQIIITALVVGMLWNTTPWLIIVGDRWVWFWVIIYRYHSWLSSPTCCFQLLLLLLSAFCLKQQLFTGFLVFVQLSSEACGIFHWRASDAVAVLWWWARITVSRSSNCWWLLMASWPEKI